MVRDSTVKFKKLYKVFEDEYQQQQKQQCIKSYIENKRYQEIYNLLTLECLSFLSCVLSLVNPSLC